jgi:hypothetical protein
LDLPRWFGFKAVVAEAPFYGTWMDERFSNQRTITIMAIISTPNNMVKKRICR